MLLASACQQDDICSAATQTTPNLVIEFYDNENPTQTKSVNNLNVSAEGLDEDLFDDVQNGNSLNVPLRTDNNVTNFRFTLNANEGSQFAPNTDSLTVSYGIDETYVSRACGYKVEFVELNASYEQEDGDSNWIESVQVQQPNKVVDEENAHIYIYF